MNERVVLRTLQANGPRSRAELSRLAGVTAPTVSKAVTSLLRSGLLEEHDAAENSRGRPAKKLRLARERAQVVGIVIDSPHCLIVSTGLDGSVHTQAKVEIPTPDSYAQLMDVLAEQIKALRPRDQISTLGIGISMPGLFDYKKGRSVLSPNVPITSGKRLGKDLKDRLGIHSVVVQESDALCLAERHYGLARGVDDFAMLDASTGIGLGVLVGGSLLKGSSGLAGELGHLPMDPHGIQCGCGRVGCLETIASDTALARLVSRRVGRRLGIDQIVDQVNGGSLNVDGELDQVTRRLAFALVTTINLFNPHTLFVHSRMFDIRPHVFDSLIDRTEALALRPSFQHCRIMRARGSKSEGAIAAIIEHLTDSRVSESTSHLQSVL